MGGRFRCGAVVVVVIVFGGKQSQLWFRLEFDNFSQMISLCVHDRIGCFCSLTTHMIYNEVNMIYREFLPLALHNITPVQGESVWMHYIREE